MEGNMTIPDKLKSKYLIQEVKKELEHEFDVDLEIKKIYLRDEKYADLFCHSDRVSLLAVVNTSVSMDVTGKIKKQLRDDMLVKYDALDTDMSEKKIFVITDFQMYHEFKKVIKEHTKVKSDVVADEDTAVELRLIEVPVFDNDFAENSDNKKFTISQLIGAMRFGVLKYDKLPPEIKEVISVMLRRLGYLDKKPKIAKEE
jgi:hypothetical protein